MSIVRTGLLGLCAQLLVVGCTAEDSGSMGESQGSESSSTMPAVDDGDATTPTAEDTSSSAGDGDVTSGDATMSAGSSSGGSSSEGDAEGSESETTAGEVVFDEEFVWVADFLRTNCTACHATNANGNLLLPSADLSNDEVRLALEGVVATTGLMLVEPGDRQASQTYLQITNEFGAQFPVEDTDRFGAWIDAGALYFAQ
jgi:hypothetical protein